MISDDKLDDLIKRIKEISLQQFDYAEDYGVLYKLLRELEQRRATELYPATKFVQRTNDGFLYQLEHVKSEVSEIEDAFQSYCRDGDEKRYVELLDEITDAQHSLQTLKEVISVTAECNNASHRRVIAKNKARGYYDDL